MGLAAISQDSLSERILAQACPAFDAAVVIARAVSGLPSIHRVPPAALVVGGFVRDALLGGCPKDVDIQVHGVHPRDLEQLMEGIFPGQVKRVGRQYEILKLAMGDSCHVDVAVPRRGIGEQFTAFEDGDPNLSIEEGGRLRDFTVNALAADPITGHVFDYWGGLRDLDDRMLRVTDPRTFVTRGLHVYRAAQLSARLCFPLEAEARPILAHMMRSGFTASLTVRVITEELKKLFVKGRKPSLGIRILWECGALTVLFPSLVAAVQDAEWESWLHGIDVAADQSDSLGLRFNDRLTAVLAAFVAPLVNHDGEVTRLASRTALAGCEFAAPVAAGVTALLCAAPRIRDLCASKPEAPRDQHPRTVRFGGLRPAFHGTDERAADLCREIFPASPGAMVAVAPVLAKGGALDARLRESLRRRSKYDRPPELISKSDLTRRFKLPNGPELGYLLGQVERKRYELVTRAAAMEYLERNLSELLSAARAHLDGSPSGGGRASGEPAE